MSVVYLVAIFVGLAAGKQFMIQHIQRVIRFHLLKVLFVNDLKAVEYVIYNLTYKVMQLVNRFTMLISHSDLCRPFLNINRHNF